MTFRVTTDWNCDVCGTAGGSTTGSEHLPLGWSYKEISWVARAAKNLHPVIEHVHISVSVREMVGWNYEVRKGDFCSPKCEQLWILGILDEVKESLCSGLLWNDGEEVEYRLAKRNNDSTMLGSQEGE